MKQILCYGDSNTWGHNPETGLRHDWNTRWPGVLARLLGEEYHVIEDGIGGRTTVFDDPYFPNRNGRKALPYALLAHASIDILIISLGSNDLKFTNALGASKGIASLLRMARNTASSNSKVPPLAADAKILVISPILLDEHIETKRPDTFPAGAYEESCRFFENYQLVCQQYGAELLDAAAFAQPSEVDCVHMNEENHNRLAHAVYEKIKEMELG